MALACDRPAEAPPSTPLPVPVPVLEPLPPEPPLPPACDRALACCHAYVDAMPEGLLVVESACAGIPEARSARDPGARCQMLIDGWRQALEHMPGAAVPTDCAAAP